LCGIKGFANPDKGFAKQDQGWQNMPEQRRGNVQTECLQTFGLRVPQRNWARNDLAIAEAEPPTGPVRPAGQKSVYSLVIRCSPRTPLFFAIIYTMIILS
jgi:hypothetical protein